MAGLGSALVIALCSFAAFAAAYFIYAELISRRLFGLRRDARMPASELEDGVDYVPTNRHILLGHHFTSIAGVAPIVGPAIAVIWGWLPALLWVTLGGIFIGAVHDFGALVISVRKQGRSIGDLAGEILGPAGWVLFLCIIFSLLAVVIAVFAWIIAGLFVTFPASVFPIWAEIPLAIWLGYMIYTRKRRVWFWSAVAVIIMFATIWVGTQFPIQIGGESVKIDPATQQPVVDAETGRPVTQPRALRIERTDPQTGEVTFRLDLPPAHVWLILLLIYAFIASQLPVQRLLQPRDYINSHELYIGMLLLFGGLIALRPDMVAPVFRQVPPTEGAQPMIPMLFVIIACGAVSGFHCLVSSGTTSKQLMNETHAKSIGYGAMLLESALSTLVIVACCAGLGLGLTVAGGEVLKGEAAYNHVYATWASSTNAVKLSAFVHGGGHFLRALGVPLDFAMTLMAVIIVSFAATTLDTATRIQRYVISELGRGARLPFLRNRTLATTLAVGAAAYIALSQGATGMLNLWKVFGTTNQLLAGLALMTITLYLVMRAKPALYTLLPMAFILIVTGWAMIWQIVDYAGKWEQEGYPTLVVIAGVVLALEIGVLLSGLYAYLGYRRRKQAEEAAAAAPAVEEEGAAFATDAHPPEETEAPGEDQFRRQDDDTEEAQG